MNRLVPLFSSVSAEWYTPQHVLQVVIKALGAIDLDPCADTGKRVPAASHFTAAEDGLHHFWNGRIFCNPPYGSHLPRWVAKFVTEYESGRVSAGILLCPARPDTRWFDRLAAYPRCFIKGRLTFVSDDPQQVSDPAGFPSMLVYAGPDLARFIRKTRRLGRTYPGAIDTSRQTNSEKRQAVLALILGPHTSLLSDREIARRARVSHTYVARLRGQIRQNLDEKTSILASLPAIAQM